MKPRLTSVSSLPVSALCLLFVAPAGAQSLQSDLAAFAETPAVTGYEQALAAAIRSRLKDLSPQADNLGNLYVTLGRGSPHRLIVAPMDEPGYVVSGITADGYLRVQRLPQLAPHGLFDLLHAAQPVVVHARNGQWIPGVVAGLSTHLQPGRVGAPRAAHPDEMYIDIGASSAPEVTRAGVDLLDPVALDRKLYDMGFGRMTAPGVGDRFGCAALVELLRRIDPGKLRGTLTVAFVAQHWADARGLDRLLAHVKPDELIYVGRLMPRRVPPGAAAGRAAQPRQPLSAPGDGVLLGTANPEADLTGLALELKQLGDAGKIHVTTDFSAPLPRSRYSQGAALPERSAHLGVATRWPVTPADFISAGDIENLVALLELYAQGSAKPPQPSGSAGLSRRVGRPAPQRPQKAPPAADILRDLVETYGVSGHEGPVREAIKRLLPPWAMPETDAAGNLVLRLGSAGAKAPRIAFVAHMDEIGYVVRSISADGTLDVQSRGGGISEFFAGHAVLVHTAGGARPGVLQLPPGWDASFGSAQDRPGFEWPR